jgi:hypothetical protein
VDEPLADRTPAGEIEVVWARTFDNLSAKIDNVEAVEDNVPRGEFPKVTRQVDKSPPQYAEEDE